MDATAIFVIHNDADRLIQLLDVVLAEAAMAVVVDNASEDDSVQALEGRERVAVIRNPDNRGFAAAVNQAAALTGTGWILLVNPDVHLQPGDVVALLTAVPGDVVAVAPLQVDGEGRPRVETGGYEPTLSRYLVWAVLPARFHGRRGPWLAPPFPTADAEVDWASGALLGIRREAFERLGRFDERYFLYHEDVDFGRRARAAGYRIWIRPSVRLHHEVAHGESSRRVKAGLRSIESVAQDFDGLRRRGLGLVLGLGYGLRALLGSGTQRAMARAALPHCRALVLGRLPTRTP